MWTAPVPQEFFGSDRIACIHMSGLLMRSQWIAGHMWTAPVPQEFFGSDRIACIHMSGLLMRSQWIAGQDGFRDASSKQPRDLLRPMGPTDCLAPRIDRSYHLLLSCSSGSTGAANPPTGRSLKRR